MIHNRIMLPVSIVLLSLSFILTPAFGGMSDSARTPGQAPTLEEVTRAGNKAVVEGDWTTAEARFREAVKLAPTQGFWRIQLVIVLGQLKKWKAAFAEMEPLLRGQAIDWILTFDQKLPDGKVAFVNTALFGDERRGITRYVAAVREKKNVDSVARDIGVKLEAYAKEHGIALIYDISKFKNLPFESGQTLDATPDFIAYYNGSAYVGQYYGTVYLYRGNDTPDYGTQIVVLNSEAVVYLDGEEFLSMPERTFIGFKVPVGRYVLQMPWKGARYVLDVEANLTYYLRIEQSVYPNVYQMFAGVDEKGALEALRKSYTLKEKNIKLKRFAVIKTNPGVK
jgi:hypothetical protein